MFYHLVNIAVRLILAVFTRSRVAGLERLPAAGGFLLVSNHLNLADPPVLGALLPRRISFMAKQELFGVPLVGWVVKHYGAFGVRRGQADRQALRRAVEVLDRGGVVGVFPEGTRSKVGMLREAHPGAALLAMMSGKPVLPVGISGTQRLRSPLSLLFRPSITVRVGEPFRLQRTGEGKLSLEEATERMMSRIAELLPEEHRGRYSAAAGPERAVRAEAEGARQNAP